MKTKEEKMAVLAEAMVIMAEMLNDGLSTSDAGDSTRYPTPEFNKHRHNILELHNRGYTQRGIARELKLAPTNVTNWIQKLGLTPNKPKKNGPGSIPRKKSLSGTRQKYSVLSTKEQNKKLKEERDNARENSRLLSGNDDGTTGVQSPAD